MSDAAQLRLTVDSAPRTEIQGTTAADLYADQREVVVAHINGELKDLSTELSDGDVVERVLVSDPEGLEVLRHSTAHVMAQAVQQLRPDAKLGIGPYITDGFYFDFDVDEPFTPEDLKKIEKSMLKIVNKSQLFQRRAVDEDEARQEMADEPYKLELIDLANGPGSGSMEESAEGASVEVGPGRSPFTTTWTDRVTRSCGGTCAAVPMYPTPS